MSLKRSTIARSDRGGWRRALLGRGPLLAQAAVLVLAGCGGDDAKPPPPPPAPKPPPTWRVVVWGAGDQQDAAIGSAIGAALLHRGLASKIVAGSGGADHVLQVTATEKIYPAKESIREGLDPLLTEQASFSTELPPGGAGPDPATALANQITDQVAARFGALDKP